LTCKKQKVLPKPLGPIHNAVLLSISVSLSQTPGYVVRKWIRSKCIALCVCCVPDKNCHS